MNGEKNEKADHETDPAHTPGDGWVDEGGASHLGPATSLVAGHARPEELERELAEDSGAE